MIYYIIAVNVKEHVFHHRIVGGIRYVAKSRISYRKCHAVRIQRPASRTEFNKGINTITYRACGLVRSQFFAIRALFSHSTQFLPLDFRRGVASRATTSAVESRKDANAPSPGEIASCLETAGKPIR